MRIVYRDDGVITAACSDDAEPEGRWISVPDKNLKKDFLKTFALGKYYVENGELVQKEGFKKPRFKSNINFLAKVRQ